LRGPHRKTMKEIFFLAHRRKELYRRFLNWMDLNHKEIESIPPYLRLMPRASMVRRNPSLH
jgi:hypothetical protein